MRTLIVCALTLLALALAQPLAASAEGALNAVSGGQAPIVAPATTPSKVDGGNSMKEEPMNPAGTSAFMATPMPTPSPSASPARAVSSPVPSATPVAAATAPIALSATASPSASPVRDASSPAPSATPVAAATASIAPFRSVAPTPGLSGTGATPAATGAESAEPRATPAAARSESPAPVTPEATDGPVVVDENIQPTNGDAAQDNTAPANGREEPAPWLAVALMGLCLLNIAALAIAYRSLGRSLRIKQRAKRKSGVSAR